MATARRNPKKSAPPPSSGDIQGRMPPHNLDMERALLCSALIDPNSIAKAVNVLHPESFYDRRHGIIFGAMERLFARNKPVDLVMVSEELTGTRELEAAGGDGYIISLTNEVATSAHIDHYAQVIREKKALRSLIATATVTAADAYEAPDAEELVDRAMSELFEIYGARALGGFQKIEPILKDLHEHLDKLHRREDDNLTGVGTGFDRLDEITSGFQRGDFIVVAGRPSMGKTAFSLDVARHACLRYGVPVAFFSLEMASMAIAMRLIAAEAHLDLHRLRSGRLSDAGWARLADATGKLSEMPFYIDDTGTLGLTELRARALMLKKQHDIGIIFIDYLQLMKPPKADSREQEVAQISRALKGLARELKVPVVAMSQLSRAVEQRGDKRPQLSDLRDSGAIEQDADVVMFIFRKAAYGEEEKGDEEKAVLADDTEVIIRKQRNGPTGTVHLIFHKEYAHFVAKEDHEAQATPSFRPDAEEDQLPPF